MSYSNDDISDDYVRDSSIYYDPTTISLIEAQDNRLYIGIIREARNVKTTNELRYMVEVFYKTSRMIIPCRMMRQFGGVYNYDDFVMRGYNYNDKGNNQNGASALAGDVVLVGKIGGNALEGIILGSMTHPARKSFLDSKKGPQYKSEFNGMETSINEDGEWTLTFKGQPTNLDKLTNAPDQPVAAPEYDKDVGTSFMKWDKEGGFTLSDEATDGDKAQKLHIDKKNGTIDIFSGKINLKFTKDGQKVELTNKETTMTTETSITYTTKKFKGEASDEIRVKTALYVVESDKVRLGEEGASDWLILGSKFRDKQKTMDGAVKGALNDAKTALNTVKAKLQAASLLKVPITGAIAGTVQLGLAATAAGDAATAIGKAADAFDAFESGGSSDNYLSAVSKTK